MWSSKTKKGKTDGKSRSKMVRPLRSMNMLRSTSDYGILSFYMVFKNYISISQQTSSVCCSYADGGETVIDNWTSSGSSEQWFVKIQLNITLFTSWLKWLWFRFGFHLSFSARVCQGALLGPAARSTARSWFGFTVMVKILSRPTQSRRGDYNRTFYQHAHRGGCICVYGCVFVYVAWGCFSLFEG